MTVLLAFALALGLSLRLTRLAISDAISGPFRAFLYRRASRHAAVVQTGQSQVNPHDPNSPQAKSFDWELKHARRAYRHWHLAVALFDCPWCIGFWISAAATAFASAATTWTPAHLPVWFAYPALTFTMSWLVGVLWTAAYTLEIWEPVGSPNRH